ncbi:hypothetical protein AB3U99_21025 [Niallia sp. JL1B1071]|uniref:hypothetical protein n=1 Tax=Niallia tiangongensis TaxID=3237105 RepID=UPI0037DC9F3A
MKNRRNGIYYWIGALLLFIGMGAVAAGIGLVFKPDGSTLGMTVKLLEESPFQNFLIPGIILFLINGIGSFFGAILSFKRHALSGIVTIILGTAMIIWISAQVYWIGWINWMQTFFFLLGIIEILLGRITVRGH